MSSACGGVVEGCAFRTKRSGLWCESRDVSSPRRGVVERVGRAVGRRCEVLFGGAPQGGRRRGNGGAPAEQNDGIGKEIFVFFVI